MSYHAHLQYAVIVNSKFWSGLPGDIRTQLDKAMAEATDYTNSIAVKENEDALAEIKKTGKTTLHDVTQALGAPNTSRAEGGQKTACYRYAGRPTVPESFIRMIGSAHKEADLTCCFSFAGDGVLTAVDSKVDQINGTLKSVAKEDAQAGQKIRCPPPLLTPETVVHLPLKGGR